MVAFLYQEERMKRLLVLAAAVVAVVSVGGVAASASSPRTGTLHLQKECSKYTGAAGDYCTIVSSNVGAIGVGSRVYYLAALDGDSFDGDVMLYAGHGNAAFGHCRVNVVTVVGRCTFTGGVGRFEEFRANVVVSVDRPTSPSARSGTGSTASATASRTAIA